MWVTTSGTVLGAYMATPLIVAILRASVCQWHPDPVRDIANRQPYTSPRRPRYLISFHQSVKINCDILFTTPGTDTYHLRSGSMLLHVMPAIRGMIW
jgi:hypothetical protein